MLQRTGAVFAIELSMTVTPLDAIARLEHALSHFEGEQENYRHRLAEARKRLATYDARVGEGLVRNSHSSAPSLRRSKLILRQAARQTPPKAARRHDVKHGLTVRRQDRLSRQPVFVVDERESGRRQIAPLPKHEVQIVLRSATRKAPDEHRTIAFGNQAPGESLSPCLSGRLHLISPRVVGK